MCTSTAHASLLPAAERATRPTANISTPPRCSASARKWRVLPTSMSLSDRFEILGEHAHMYPQGTRKASKVGCKAHRAQLRTHQNGHCIFRTEEYSLVSLPHATAHGCAPSAGWMYEVARRVLYALGSRRLGGGRGSSMSPGSRRTRWRFSHAWPRHASTRSISTPVHSSTAASPPPTSADRAGPRSRLRLAYEAPPG